MNMVRDNSPDDVLEWCESTGEYICPKCGSASGGDWSQCKRRCPVKTSPHFDSITREAFMPVPHTGDYH
jgi:hypothetical protein